MWKRSSRRIRRVKFAKCQSKNRFVANCSTRHTSSLPSILTGHLSHRIRSTSATLVLVACSTCTWRRWRAWRASIPDRTSYCEKSSLTRNASGLGNSRRSFPAIPWGEQSFWKPRATRSPDSRYEEACHRGKRPRRWSPAWLEDKMFGSCAYFFAGFIRPAAMPARRAAISSVCSPICWGKLLFPAFSPTLESAKIT